MLPILFFGLIIVQPKTKIGIYLRFLPLFTTDGKDVPHLNSITMKYFEKGHTFMSADTYHHLVEKAMCEVKNVYDYRDFVSCLEKSGVALELNSLNFFEIPRGLSGSKRTRNKPKLDNVCVVRFVRGSTHIFWKESMGAGKSKSSEFLLKKISDKILSGLLFPAMYPNGFRGVPVNRKDDILTKLCPLMPENRRQFWKNLKTNNDDTAQH